MKKKKPKTVTKRVKVWVDVGSNGGIFQFELGMVANCYPNLMHVYSKPALGLSPATITYKVTK